MGKKQKNKQMHYLQTNTVATRQKVISDFRTHICYVIVLQKRLCELNSRESGNKEGFNQIGSLTIS